jgi:hypothetical protein
MEKKAEPITIIKKYGYEYHLVQVDRGNAWGQPAIFGMKGYALKTVKKIKG